MRDAARKLAVLAGVAAVLGVLVVPPVGAQQEPEPVVEAARQVTQRPDPSRLYVIPQLAVHPDDPDTVALVAPDFRLGGCPLYVTRDGGASWLLAADDLLPEDVDFCIRRPFGPTVDPQFAADGTLYVGMGGSFADQDHPNGPTVPTFARTSNLGRSHEATVVSESGEVEGEVEVEVGDGSEGEQQTRTESVTVREQQDHASVAIDPTNSERVYMGWRLQTTEPPVVAEGFPRGTYSIQSLRSEVAVSDDGGETWSDPVDLTKDAEGELPEGGTDYPVLVTEDDGTVHAFTKERKPSPEAEDAPPPNNGLFMFTSTDDGESWTAERIYEGVPDIGTPDAAINRETGNIHLVWEETRTLDEEVDGEPVEVSDVKYMSSSDGGESWTDPVMVVDQEAADNYNQYFPGVSVAPNGRVDVAWHDFRNDPFFAPTQQEGHDAGERYSSIYGTYSTDRGRTWSQDLRLSDRLIDRSLGVTFAGATRGPIGTASTNDAMYVTWPDSRAASEVRAVEDAYFTRVRMSSDARLSGAAAGDGSGLNALSIALGAAGALLLAGLVMWAVVRRRRPATTGSAGDDE